jgi:hypothetical protein
MRENLEELSLGRISWGEFLEGSFLGAMPQGLMLQAFSLWGRHRA